MGLSSSDAGREASNMDVLHCFIGCLRRMHSIVPFIAIGQIVRTPLPVIRILMYTYFRLSTVSHSALCTFFCHLWRITKPLFKAVLYFVDSLRMCYSFTWPLIDKYDNYSICDFLCSNVSFTIDSHINNQPIVLKGHVSESRITSGCID